MFRKTNHSSGRTRLGRPTPAMAVACAALFMSLGGVGYAAATIGSSQIKNNSVQGKDIKNSTIQGKDIKNSTIQDADISPATRAALKGQNGAQGSQGPQGLQGQQGPNGIVAPASASNGSQNIAAGGTSQVVVPLAVPAGRYVVHAKTNLFSVLADRTMDCFINNGNAQLDAIQWDSVVANENSPASLVAVATVTTGPLSLRCAHDGAANTPGGAASDSKLIAIPVS